MLLLFFYQIPRPIGLCALYYDIRIKNLFLITRKSFFLAVLGGLIYTQLKILHLSLRAARARKFVIRDYAVAWSLGDYHAF